MKAKITFLIAVLFSSFSTFGQASSAGSGASTTMMQQKSNGTGKNSVSRQESGSTINESKLESKDGTKTSSVKSSTVSGIPLSRIDATDGTASKQSSIQARPAEVSINAENDVSQKYVSATFSADSIQLKSFSESNSITSKLVLYDSIIENKVQNIDTGIGSMFTVGLEEMKSEVKDAVNVGLFKLTKEEQRTELSNSDTDDGLSVIATVDQHLISISNAEAKSLHESATIDGYSVTATSPDPSSNSTMLIDPGKYTVQITDANGAMVNLSTSTEVLTSVQNGTGEQSETTLSSGKWISKVNNGTFDSQIDQSPSSVSTTAQNIDNSAFNSINSIVTDGSYTSSIIHTAGQIDVFSESSISRSSIMGNTNTVTLNVDDLVTLESTAFNMFGYTASLSATGPGGSGSVEVGAGTVALGGNVSALTGSVSAQNVVLSSGTSSRAPLRFSTGTNATTPINGAVEYDGSKYYATAGGSRYELVKVLNGSATLDFPGTNTQSSSDLTISVTGASVGDVVSLGIPATAMVAGSCGFIAWVSAANTVTVRFNNFGLISIDPLSATFNVTIKK